MSEGTESCQHTATYYCKESDNYYCHQCKRGMGIAYYDAMRRSAEIGAEIATLTKSLEEARKMAELASRMSGSRSDKKPEHQMSEVKDLALAFLSTLGASKKDPTP